MKTTHTPQSATSLPRAPRDEAHTRMTKYFVMMSVRVLCFVLMVVVTPYGWYTWLFALGAIILPYLAVVVANVSSRGGAATRISPERSLPAPPEAPASAPPAAPTIRIQESPPPPAPRPDPDPDRPGQQ